MAFEAWRVAGSKPPVTTLLESKYVGRFIGVKIRFTKMNPFGKMIRRFIHLFVASLYHPMDESDHDEFNELFNSLMTSVPKLDDFIVGHDFNANVRIIKIMYVQLLGPFGIDNRNRKGRKLLVIILNNYLKIVNSFINKSTYTTWISFGKTRSPHTLDIITT